MRTTAILAGTSLLLLGCATPVQMTPETLAQADYGPEPVGFEDALRSSIAQNLKDPYSAVITFGPAKRVWVNSRQGILFGYVVVAAVNARNGFGAYTGNEYYPYFFHGTSWSELKDSPTRYWWLADGTDPAKPLLQ
jgi:hypothetical protein